MRTVILLSILFVTCQSDDFISFEKLQENSIEVKQFFIMITKNFQVKFIKSIQNFLEFELKDGRYNGFFKEFYPGGSIKRGKLKMEFSGL